MSSDSMTTKLAGDTQNVGRRGFLTGAALGVGAAALPLFSEAASPVVETLVARDGKYARVPLAKETLRVTAVQSLIRGVDWKNPKPGMKANLDHMIEMLDNANGAPGPRDLVCFHEQPIMGYGDWTREQALRVSIELPGEETEALGKKAREHGCYISFCTYAVDKDWSGHLLLIGVLINPEGKIAAKHWKLCNARDLRPGSSIYTTTVYDVLDRYTEMYGQDAVLPVARTPIGNLSLTCTPIAAEVHRALAMKGVEISLRTASGGYLTDDANMDSFFNSIYTVVTNNSNTPDSPDAPKKAAGGGNTAIYGPHLTVVGKAQSDMEELVSGVIPIAEFRGAHVLPEVPMAMIMPVFNQYLPRYSSGLQSRYIPNDGADAARYYTSKRNW